MTTNPPQTSMKAARQEAEMVMFESVECALRKAGLTAKQVRRRLHALPPSGPDAVRR